MQLSDLLSPDCTKCAVEGASKKRLLETISAIAAPKLVGITKHDIFESLINRERLGSTGIGLGIAIPHGRLANATQPVAVLMTLDQPIEFDAIDNQPVDIVFALLVPESEHENHLNTLATVAKRMNNKECTRSLRDAHSDRELYTIFVSEDQAPECNLS
ncbi:MULTISPECIES: PTS IIA-like nitrogen regulatory protein PtsN [Idiomarina]|mgnify:CR=1 FL=1|jgi:PTS system nitrogen regulatory IIA component|uniref:PTS IIA-like nitrogen-regulatory protein PtsN n=2 Tax=Idiomarina baltica TaxID=190892 RepID=A0A348WNJ2_9GAMM|nr:MULTISPECIES: PTS IIA-like nitrogen regulatory protein PtsN [Idiomarina]EAQ31102.1 Phosphotransferase system mannitol/fructose-specific IIA domain (Ntr-type) [Idiomarina baltica OS145]HAE89927.1 PTS IIA-like nitrogen-regulatory protein PtsN [Idiomarina sp.]HAR56104.1 PTS IIA-like nitrogen-regulatory protein PtsN [Idiomarina baltica]|tara:strand:+ start:201 stop:677 length:477 start_codon:yes stop_codon:yes gene_type:complete